MTDLGDFESYDPDEEAEDEGEDGGDVDGNPSEAGEDVTDSPDSTEQTPDDGFTEVDVEPAGTDRGLGSLSVSAGLAIGEEADETTIQAYVTTGNRGTVRIGTYLVVPYPDDELLFGRITALEYAQEFHADDATEIQARRAMRSGEIDELDYKFLATVEPLAVLYDDAGELRRRMPDRVPKPQAIVREAAGTAEIKTGLDIPPEGIFLGHLAVGGEVVRTTASPPTIDYRLIDDYDAGDPLVFRHTLVAGGTGSGKTHAAKNVLRQLLADGRRYPVETGGEREVRPSVVVFDPQDEYAQMHDDNPEATDEDRRRWEREGIAHGGYDDTVAFVPDVADSTYAADHHRAEQIPFSVPFTMVRRRPWLIAAGSLNDNQYNGLEFLLGRYFREAADPTYRGFVDFLEDPALREELDESGRVHEATFDAVARRVRSRAHTNVFDQDAPPVTDQIHQLVRPGGLTTVPTYHVGDSRATAVIVLALASLLVDEKLSNDPRYDRIKETPLVLGMDEAHNFLADAETAQAQRVVGKFTEAAKQGRKERLGLFLITQDPQDVADPVFKQVNTTVVLNLGDEDAIKSVNIPTNLEGKVPYMETGQMVVYSPDNSEPVELAGLSTCVTRHGRG